MTTSLLASSMRWTRAAALMAVAVVLVADTVTKAWARQYTAAAHPAWVRVTDNPGASFGLGSGSPHLVDAVGVLIIFALLAVVLRTSRAGLAVSLAVVLGGGAANLADRSAHGFVTDWIHLPWYSPSFNVADVAIRAGAVAALLTLWATPRPAPEPGSAAGTDDSRSHRSDAPCVSGVTETEDGPQRQWARTEGQTAQAQS